VILKIVKFRKKRGGNEAETVKKILISMEGAEYHAPQLQGNETESFAEKFKKPARLIS